MYDIFLKIFVKFTYYFVLEGQKYVPVKFESYPFPLNTVEQLKCIINLFFLKYKLYKNSQFTYILYL